MEESKGTPASGIRDKHGDAVLFARRAIMLAAIASTRGPALNLLLKGKVWKDWLVLGLSGVSAGSAFLAASIDTLWLLTALAILAGWRMYDVTCNHFYILIVDRSDLIDEGYRSSIRAFVLAGFNLVEVACAMFVLEKYMLWAGWTDCLFVTGEGASRYSPMPAFVANIYRITSLSSIDAACAGQSWLAFAFAITSTVAVSMIVLVVVARAISSIPFVDRSKG